jgi:peroxiredoxin
MADLPQQGESLPDLELTTESGEHIGTGELRGQMIVMVFQQYKEPNTLSYASASC